MILYNHWPWWKSVLNIKPDARTLATREAEDLALDVLQRELMLIDDQYMIKARKAKIEFIHKQFADQ